MIHLGDITQLRGDQIPVVDIITGGSPCQDLSVAGKRAGLEGERSGLFMEQIRIVKEMRERDRRAGRTDWAVRPRFMVWENVPGAFSSNGGKDFQAVLTEIVKIAEPDAPDVPLPDKGKWSKAGCLYSDVGEWSVAWRVHDAQFWGVPQRRKRIALVADFGGLSAPEVLFERKGLSGDPESCGTAREGAAGGAGGGVASTSGVVTKGNGEAFLTPEKHTSLSVGGGQAGQGYPAVLTQSAITIDTKQQSLVTQEEMAATLGVNAYKEPKFDPNPSKNQGGIAIVQEPLCIEITSTKNTIVEDGISPTLTARMGTGGNQVNAVQTYQEVTGTLNPGAHAGSYNGQDAYNDMLITGCFQNTGRGWWNESDIGATIRTPCGGDSTKANLVAAVDCRNGTENPDVNGTLQAKSNGGFSYICQTVCRTNQTVRRLTPLECERLQGFPDGWTDIGDWVDSKGKKHKVADSQRYKALGNSIALPFWFWLLRRISAQYERPATLGSLFDGIGGFPLCWERCNGKGTAIWASEIEEFPVAVTKKHFPEEKETT